MRAPRMMPLSRLEAATGRVGSVAVLWGNVILATAASVLLWGTVLFASPIAGDATWAAPILLAVPVLWWALVAFLFVTVHRRRTSPADIVPAREGTPHGILVPGRRVHTAMLLIVACAATGFCLILAVVVGDAWAIIWVVFAAMFFAALVSTAISAAHPRRLVLHQNGIGSASFFSDAAVQWGDIERIEYTEGAAGLMVLRVHTSPAATTFEEHWRHPFRRGSGTIDIEALTLGLDGTMLWLALRLYATDPTARAELASGRAPARLFDPAVATAVPYNVAHPVVDVFRPAGAR